PYSFTNRTGTCTTLEPELSRSTRTLLALRHAKDYDSALVHDLNSTKDHNHDEQHEPSNSPQTCCRSYRRGDTRRRFAKYGKSRRARRQEQAAQAVARAVVLPEILERRRDVQGRQGIGLP